MKIISYRPKTERLAMQQQQMKNHSKFLNCNYTIRQPECNFRYAKYICFYRKKYLIYLVALFHYFSVFARARFLCRLRLSDTVNSNKRAKNCSLKKTETKEMVDNRRIRLYTS
jgi:hypothetical protein